MRTKRIKIYLFAELGKQVQDKIIESYLFIPEERNDLFNYLKSLNVEYLINGTVYTTKN